MLIFAVLEVRPTLLHKELEHLKVTVVDGQEEGRLSVVVAKVNLNMLLTYQKSKHRVILCPDRVVNSRELIVSVVSGDDYVRAGC